MFKKIVKGAAGSISTFVALAAPAMTMAALKPGTGFIKDAGALEARVNATFNIVMGIVGIIVLIYIILAGFGYLTSAGNSEKVTAAKNQIIYAIIGAVIIAASFFLKDLIFTRVFGLSTGTDIPTPGTY